MNNNKFEYIRGISDSRPGFNLPTRATKSSCGYDFHTPVEFTVEPHSTTTIRMGVKCRINEGEFLFVAPRSSMGFNGRHIVLTNTVGLIDPDYYSNPNNDGEICARFANLGDEPITFKKNDRVMQGVFLKFDTTSDDCATNERVGGLGSTGD